MKSCETLIRLKKFQVEERRRTVAQIESMISGFERISADLERDIKTPRSSSFRLAHLCQGGDPAPRQS